LNEALLEKLDRWLEKAYVIHVTGKGKAGLASREGYVSHELLDLNGMMAAYASADVIVTRAGIGALSEIAALKKSSIIVPIPGTHQEENALRFDEAEAGLYVRQDQDDFADILFQQTMSLVSNVEKRREMGEKAHAFFKTDDGSAFADLIIKKTERSRSANA
jgi:UDP-N-acetylglucosamine--N-acetylmuramyl-(pentapeptide) pyrophosphoryl-undecaprenol N-acetylglucosamine transferase